MEVIPAIISDSYEDFEKKVRSVEPYVDRVHLDIMDGVLVSNRTITGIEEINKINTRLNFDVHLMVRKPQYSFGEWFDTKADRFFVHAESDVDIESFIRQARSKNKTPGVVLNPGGDADRLKSFMHLISDIQFMTVNPGYYGNYFIESVLPQINAFHMNYPHVKIYVDGGMNPDTAKRAVAVGASGIISGSYIFKHPQGVKAGIEEIKKAINHF